MIDVTIIGVYLAPLSAARAEETNAMVLGRVSEILDVTPVRSVPLVLGDLNAHFDGGEGCGDGVVGGWVDGFANENGQMVYDLASHHHLGIINTHFIHSPTFFSPKASHGTINDYILASLARLPSFRSVWVDMQAGDGL